MEKISRRAETGWVSFIISMHDLPQLEQGNYKKTGTILKKKAGRRGDSVLLFLKGFGTLWGFSTSSQKNKFPLGLEPLNWGVFEIYQGPRSATIKSIEVKEDFFHIRKSYSRLLMAVNWSKLLASHLLPAYEQDALLVLYWNSMKQLETSHAPITSVEFRFLWRWAKIIGLAPSLTHCSHCGKLLDRARRSNDGFLCEKCDHKAQGNILSIQQLRYMQFIAMSPTEQFLKWQGTHQDESWVQAQTLLLRELIQQCSSA